MAQLQNEPPERSWLKEAIKRKSNSIKKPNDFSPKEYKGPNLIYKVSATLLETAVREY